MICQCFRSMAATGVSCQDCTTSICHKGRRLQGLLSLVLVAAEAHPPKERLPRQHHQYPHQSVTTRVLSISRSLNLKSFKSLFKKKRVVSVPLPPLVQCPALARTPFIIVFVPCRWPSKHSTITEHLGEVHWCCTDPQAINHCKGLYISVSQYC